LDKEKVENMYIVIFNGLPAGDNYLYHKLADAKKYAKSFLLAEGLEPPKGFRVDWDYEVGDNFVSIDRETDSCQFLELGEIVRAKTTVYDLPPDTSWIHAEKGDLGQCIHIEPGFYPTVRFFDRKTCTCVTPQEVKRT
jgi:hypothetical protein